MNIILCINNSMTSTKASRGLYVCQRGLWLYLASRVFHYETETGRAAPDVLLFVLLCDLDVPAVRLQLVSRHLTQDLLIHREKHLQPALLDVIIPDTTHTHTQLERHSWLKSITLSCISDVRVYNHTTHKNDSRIHNTNSTYNTDKKYPCTIIWGDHTQNKEGKHFKKE